MKLAFLLQFISRWKTFTSHDLGRALGRNNVDVSQYGSSLTDICVTLVVYRYDSKRGNATSWLLQDLH